MRAGLGCSSKMQSGSAQWVSWAVDAVKRIWEGIAERGEKEYGRNLLGYDAMERSLGKFRSTGCLGVWDQ